MTLSLIAIGLSGVLMLYLLFTPRIHWNWSRYANMSREEARKAAPLWLGFISVLSVAAIVFSVHALLFVHGIVK